MRWTAAPPPHASPPAPQIQTNACMSPHSPLSRRASARTRLHPSSPTRLAGRAARRTFLLGLLIALAPASASIANGVSTLARHSAARPSAGVAKAAAATAGRRRARTDRRAPAAPSRLRVHPRASSVRLTWRASRDNVGVAGYRVYRSGRQIARVGARARSYTDTRVARGRRYRYTVRAFDRAGNRSAPSRAVKATVPARGSGPPGAGGGLTQGGAQGGRAATPAPGGGTPGSGGAPTGDGTLTGGGAQPAGAPTADLPGWQHVFADDFSTPTTSFPGPAYAAKWWAYPSGWTDTSRNMGRALAEQGHYDCAKTCSVDNGALKLNLHSEGGTPYIAAPVARLPGSLRGVTSTPSGQLYGRYSVRFRASATGPGYKIAWLLWPDSGSWPAGGEIDYPEGSIDQGFAGFVHHSGAVSGSDQKRIPSSGLAGSFSQWHTATIEWTPTKVEYFLDDRSLGAETAGIPNTPMHWVLQSETEVTSTPTPDASTAGIEIDWVSVWKRTTTTPAPSP